MNKLIPYAIIALILGLSATMVPLVIIAQIKPSQTGAGWFSAYSKGLERLDNPRRYLFDSNQQYQNLSSVDPKILGISFFVAIVLYAFFRRKGSRRENRSIRPCP